MAVEIYTTNFCGYCLLAKRILKRKNISFVEINLDIEMEKRVEMNKRSRGRTTVPQIFFSDLHIGGHNELSVLEKTGRLDVILTKQKLM